MASRDDKQKSGATTVDTGQGELQREGGLPIAMCPVTERIRPLGQGGMCFEAFWNASKEKDPTLTAQEAHDQWRKI